MNIRLKLTTKVSLPILKMVLSRIKVGFSFLFLIHMPLSLPRSLNKYRFSEGSYLISACFFEKPAFSTYSERSSFGSLPKVSPSGVKFKKRNLFWKTPLMHFKTKSTISSSICALS